MEQFYIKTEECNNWKGPYTLNSILEMNLSENTLIWKENIGNPFKLKDFEGYGQMGIINSKANKLEVLNIEQFEESSYIFKETKELKIKETNSAVEHVVLGRVKFANFWLRLLGWFIDTIILLCIYSFIWALFNFPVPDGANAIFQGKLYIFSQPIFLISSCLYNAILESSNYQATPGKLIMGIKVTNENYNKINFINAVGRYFGKVLAGFTFGLGFLIIFVTKNRQGFHDQMAKTLVIKEDLKRTDERIVSILVLIFALVLYLFALFI